MAIIKVQKRSGAIVDFDISKIEKAIHGAAKSVGKDDDKIAYTVARAVVVELEDRFKDVVPMVENIQDLAEEMLIKYDYNEVGKAYILYREKRREAREHTDVVVEVDKTISEYLTKADWRVNANSNQGYSLGGMILNTSGKVTANYWLSYIYPKAIGDAHRNADMHIHDLGYVHRLLCRLESPDVAGRRF